MGVRASFEPMIDRYLFPALRALGDAWQAGDVSVAAEHAASAAVARWIGAAYDAAGSNGPTLAPSSSACRPVPAMSSPRSRSPPPLAAPA